MLLFGELIIDLFYNSVYVPFGEWIFVHNLVNDRFFHSSEWRFSSLQEYYFFFVNGFCVF